MSAIALLPPARSAVECYSWLQREDLTRYAVKAYEMARRDCEPEGGQLFVQDGDSWADRDTFMRCLIDNIDLLIKRHGYEVGLYPAFGDLERLQLIESDYRRQLAAEAALAQEVAQEVPA